MRWFLIAPVVLFAVGVVMYLLGLFRARSHTVRARARFASPPDTVWKIVADFERWAEWQPGLKRVELLPGVNGMTTLIAEGSWGEMPMRIEVAEPPRRLVTFLDGGTYTGRWTWDLEAVPEGGTIVTLTEEGEVRNPFFRTAMILNDKHKSILAAQTGLAAELRETVTPERIR